MHGESTTHMHCPAVEPPSTKAPLITYARGAMGQVVIPFSLPFFTFFRLLFERWGFRCVDESGACNSLP